MLAALSSAGICVAGEVPHRYVEWLPNATVDAGSGRVARLASNIIRESEAIALANVVGDHVADLKKLDSTDRLPAYEMYVINHGQEVHPVASELAPLWDRMTGYAREHYAEACAECHLCTVLLRRYQPSERTHVHSHFDRNAVVTAVASLNGGQQEFEGGLFLQRTARPSSREFFATTRTDAVFHGYDLNHGVDVPRGLRYSAIFWFSDRADHCAARTSPWYEAPAAAGSMDAQEALAELYQLGSSGYERDPAAAARWYELASAQGSANAQSKLGRMLLAGEGVPRDKEAGMRWVRQAADQGYAPAEYTLGVACQYGDAEGGLEEAARWFAAAAAQGDADAQCWLGACHAEGRG